LPVAARFGAVDKRRNQPARDEHCNDEESERSQGLVEAADRAPEMPRVIEMPADQAQGLDAADQERDGALARLSIDSIRASGGGRCRNSSTNVSSDASPPSTSM